MRSHTYTKFDPRLADAVDLQSLLDNLADFLLQSGFAGDTDSFWNGEDFEADQSVDALKRAILQALIESGQITPEMLEALRGDGDEISEEELAKLLDGLVERLVEDGFLKLDQPAKVPSGHQPVTGKGSLAQAAANEVQFSMTERGIDFLGYKTLRHLLGSLGKSSVGSHDTPQLATGVESDAWSKPYEFGDTLNLDVPATLSNALARNGNLDVPIDLDYSDLMVRQSEYRSSCATVLMLDTSHSMILYGEDRFTPAKKVALALAHLIRTQYPGDSLKVVLFHDSAEELPLAKLATTQVGPYHTNTAEGLRVSRRLLQSQRKEMKQIVMVTDGKPTACFLDSGAGQSFAYLGGTQSTAGKRRLYKNSMGGDPFVMAETFREVQACRKAGIMINTFMLASDYYLVEFVKQMTAMTNGKAYFANPGNLSQFVLVDFLRRRTSRVR